ncbi:MAG: cation-translocating P-type ATPase, partial [Oscillospiraceae bacterium]
RRLHAVETLGCANIICSDKTGTLTENKMTVKAISTYDYQVDITGSAQTAIGEFKISGKKADVLQSYSLSMLFDIAVMCNNAAISEKQPKSKNSAATKDTTLEVFGEPTETALLVMAAKAGLYREKLSYSIEKEIPFDSTRKMMSVVVKQKHGSRLIFSKGAPDILLSKCSYCLTKEGVKILTPAMSKAILKSNNSMAESALRVLGFAYRIVNSEHDTAEKDLVFVGLAGLLDPPRREAYEAVATCRKAHIKPIMITGDYELTAKAIAKDLKIFTAGDEIVSGKELDTMSDDTLKNRLNNISVFARVTPAHKLKIVRALKAQGNIVAMTGDGVNDAPAIKEADIGVAMGISGTDVTKEAASVILLDDNFATLVSAVKEGRIIYQNIRKFIRYLLPCNIGEVITMFFAMLMGMPIPLLPIQILLINLVTDGLPAIALGLEPGEPDVMKRKPRRANESIFSGGLSTTIVIRGFLIGLTTLAVFSKLLSIGSGIEAARTGALLTLVATQLIHVFECKSETRSIFSINPFNNIKLIMAVLISAAAVLIAIYIPAARLIFATAPLTFEQIIISLGYCAVVPIISSVLLILRSKKTTKRPQHSKKTQTDMLF